MSSKYYNEQKSLEVFFLRSFLRFFENQTKGKLIFSEKPDFIFKLSKKASVGIEITQFKLYNKSEVYLKNEIEKLKEDYFNRYKNYLSVLFSINNKFDHNQIIEFINNNVGSSTSIFKRFNKNLPKGLSSMIIIKNLDDNYSYWTYCSSKIKFNELIEELKNSILKKEKKFFSYQSQRLNEQWLIVVADYFECINKMNLSNIKSKLNISTSFDKVFILDFFSQKIFEL